MVGAVPASGISLAPRLPGHHLRHTLHAKMSIDSSGFRFDDLANRTVVLTGGAMGIGRGLSRGLARQGVKLILIDRDEKNLAENVAALRADGAAHVESHVIDLGDASARQRA